MLSVKIRNQLYSQWVVKLLHKTGTEITNSASLSHLTKYIENTFKKYSSQKSPKLC